MQKGGLGKGGETYRNFSTSTYYALYRRGWIRDTKFEWPNQKYVITEKGREALKRCA
jgi:hypothetical protein